MGKTTENLLRDEAYKKAKREIKWYFWKGEKKPAPGYEIIRGSSFVAVRCENNYLYRKDEDYGN